MIDTPIPAFDDTNLLHPVLPLRDIVVFPGMIVPLFVGREKSIRALERASQQKIPLILTTQKDATQDDPTPNDIYRVGVFANILQLLRLPDGTVKVLVEGEHRVQVQYFMENEKYFEGHATIMTSVHGDNDAEEGLKRSILRSFDKYVKMNKKVPQELMQTLEQMQDSSLLADTVAAHLMLKNPEKQSVLEQTDVIKRMEQVFELVERESSVLTTEKRIRSRVRTQMEKSQKEYYLNEQMKAIQKELGDEDAKGEIENLHKRIEATKLTKEAREKAMSELKKLRHMSPMSAEATVVRNYLEWLLDIPWKKRSKLKYDIPEAEKILDDDHYSLEKVKERIIEFLAVQQRTNSVKGQIICLMGPPGVGKTSLAKSIAKATGRNFVRVALGGVRDESEIRGHRRTYIGSMPGRIIQSMKKAKTSNPLFLLDEIDKLGHDYRGDPAAALLEVLDPEQNHAFNDHYLEVDYNLSDVLFITTANSLNMPRPLLDRLEIIRLSGYTEDEKVEIARRHLIPKQIKEHGMKEGEFTIEESAVRAAIRHYTRESGVRNLEREIAKTVRKSLTKIVKGTEQQVVVTAENIKDFLGVPRFDHHVIDKDDHVGVTTGLAYTEVGGDLLPIEAVMIPGGKGKVTLTGKLGDVMQESAQAAWSYVRSRSHVFGIRKEQFWRNDVHIHVPEGATPKDGPSAGAAICTSIVSMLTGIPVRKDLAMTGEISLRGNVLPIGGLKEKLLAALRGGIKVALIPEKNVKDLEDIPDNVKTGLTIIAVSTVDEVLKHALTAAITPLSWDEMQKDLAIPVVDVPGASGEIVAH